MPHVVVQYTANLDPEAQIGALCKTLAEIIVAQRDGAGARVFPIGGTRVLAYPAPHFAVADGAPIVPSCTSTFASRPAASRARRRRGRGDDRGGALALRGDLRSRPVGITLQIDEGRAGVRRQAQQPASAVRRTLSMLDDATIAALAAELHDAQRRRVQVRHFSRAIPA